MPIGQNLLALMGAEMPRDKLSGLGTAKGESPAAEGLAAFSSVLAAQQPAELKALISQFSQAQEAIAAGEEGMPGFAADGKSLPVEIRDWLQQLAALESPLQGAAESDGGGAELTLSADGEPQEDADLLAALSSQWQQWLSQLPQEGSGADAATQAVSSPVLAQQMTAAEASKVLAQAADASLAAGASGDKSAASSQNPLSLPEMLAQLRAAMAGSAAADAEAAVTANEDSTLKGKTQSADADDKLLTSNRQANSADQPQQTQRVANLAASVDSQGLFAARLAEQKGGDPAKQENSAIDALGSQNKSAVAAGSAQGALTQRPVAGAAQSLAVPFGQSGWSESVVNKVMWMSSQNLRSVEIQLDPAELGPLEIKIQARGLEHQVQFVSQNPAVREALEGHMHRLRELFSQQGVDQLDVTVSDGNSGQQRGNEAAGGFAGGDSSEGRAGGSAASASRASGEDELPMAAAQQIAANSRLVDYYA